MQLAGQFVILSVGQELITEPVDIDIPGSKIPQYLKRELAGQRHRSGRSGF